MLYMGGKHRLAKDLLPIILAERRDESQLYWEPFVGGGNVIQYVKGKRLGTDIFEPVINALISIRDFPKELPASYDDIHDATYRKIKKGEADHPHKDYILHACSFRGTYRGGFAHFVRRQGVGHERNYVRDGFNSAQKQSEMLQGVLLECADYRKAPIDEGVCAVIYCDPPYINTTPYTGNKGAPFNHEEFWEWCRQKTRDGNKVFISESVAPEDFECVFEKTLTNDISFGKNKPIKTRVERLFRYKMEQVV